MYTQILVPTDGSEVAQVAVEHALDIAEMFDAEVHALYIADIDAISYGLGTEQVELLRRGEFGNLDKLQAEAEEATGYIVEQAEERGLTSHEIHLGGTPHTQITDYAESEGIDLIIMGSHGRSGVRRALLGSVTERTLRSTEIPILVVDYHGVGTAES